MKRSGSLVPASLLILVWAVLAFYVWTLHDTPLRIATHFNAAGQPDGWMTRQTHARMILAGGFGVPLLILGIFALIRRWNGAGLNIPNRDYWLAPERRAETVDFVWNRGLWLAALLGGFFVGIHWLILRANDQNPAHLPGMAFAIMLGIFLTAMALWSIGLFRRFRRPA